MYKHTQRSFAGGQLDRELMGRQDLQKYFTGASELRNLLVRRQGNLAKRRGTDFAADLTGILGEHMDCGLRVPVPLGAHRLVPLTEERDQGYYALLAGRRAFLLDTRRGILCADGEWRRAATEYDAPDMDATGAASEYEMENAFVAEIEGEFFDTFADALAALGAGETLTLGQNAQISANATVKGKIDLNGHRLDVTGGTTITFAAGAGKECGIVSSRQGGSVAWTGDGAASANVAAFLHTSGVLVLRDFSAEYPATGSSAKLLFSNDVNAADRIEITRCALTAHGGHGVVYLSGIPAAQQETSVEEADEYGLSGYSWRSAGCLLRGCSLTYSTAAAASAAVTNPAPLMIAAYNANARRFSFVAGTISSNGGDRLAANAALDVYGGRLDCSGIGQTLGASYAAIASKMRRGICVAKLATGFVADNVDETEITVDGDTLYAYAPTGETYGPEDNAWRTAEWSEDAAGGTAPGEGSTASLTVGTAPYCVATPYADGELDELDVFQSGDTLLLAHRRHAPAKLAFDPAALTLSFARLRFNASAWRRPVIRSVAVNVNIPSDTLQYSGTTATKTSTTYSGTTKTTTVYQNDVQKAQTQTGMPRRTVRYVATYVKDGLESPPSHPMEASYGAPWQEGGTITLALDRGGNAEEPDFYNVYKSVSAGYGFAGSTAKRAATSAVPEARYGYAAGAAGGAGAAYAPRGMAAAEATPAGAAKETLAATEIEDVLGGAPETTFSGRYARVESGGAAWEAPVGVGGVRFGEKAAAVLEFGRESAVSAERIVLAMDAHALEYEGVTPDGQASMKLRSRLSGRKVKVTVYHQPTSGSVRGVAKATREATLEAFDGAWTGEHVKELGEVSLDGPRAALAALASVPLRIATLDFSDVLGGRQIVRVTVECEDEGLEGDDKRAECVLCGFRLEGGGGGGNTFTDDYVTPDMSLTPPSADGAFEGSGNYPSCVGMFQQRLVFAASERRPFAFWLSATGDLYTFAPHESIREDDAIEAELAATEFPRINHVVSGRDLVMLGDGGEWKIAPVSGNALTYKTISATLQGTVGSAKWLKPLAAGNEIVFAERTGTTLRSIAYNYASDGYETTDLTVLAGNIFAGNPIRRMCYKQHPDSTIVCVLADGTLAAMVYMPEHEVAAWTRHVLGGGAEALDCATSKALRDGTTDVALTVRRGGSVELWAARPDGPDPTAEARACMDGCRVLTGAEASTEWLDGWTAVDLLTAATYASKAALQGVDGYGARSYLVGFPFLARLATVRPEPPQQGTIQFEVKNAKDVEVRVLESGSWRAAPAGYAGHAMYAHCFHAHVTADGGVVALDSSDHTLLLSGANTGDGRVEIESDDPWPLNILSLSVNYEIQPLSNSEG